MAGRIGSTSQIKDLVKLKDRNNNSLLAYAAYNDNAVLLNAAMACVVHYLSSQEVICSLSWDNAINHPWEVSGSRI